jgi:hypothetical protein
MSAVVNKYEASVIKSILANNEFGIEEVVKLQDFKCTYFREGHYQEIRILIERGEIDWIKAVPSAITPSFKTSSTL